MNYIIFKDIDFYFIHYNNLIIKNKLKDFYAFWNYYNNQNYKVSFFNESCIFGNLNVCKFYYFKLKSTSNFDLDMAFQLSCGNGHLHIAQWLLSLQNSHGKIDIHDNNDCAFQLSCKYGHLPVAQWLLSLETPMVKLIFMPIMIMLFDGVVLMVIYSLLNGYYSWKIPMVKLIFMLITIGFFN